MRLYLLIIALADLILWAAHGFNGAIFVFGGTAAVIALDGVGAFLLRRLPERWFTQPWTIGKFERRFYKRIGIRKWKDAIPELGGFTGFHKDHVERDAAFVHRFLLESRYGILIHLENIPGGLLLLLFLPPSYALPIAAVNALLSLLPLMVLRYNLHTLQYLYQKARA
ncbi:MAG: hypothetical protein J6R33_01555 [Clostridia bacterium]|nr:hypothetical protein [Clostridia bacterium]